MTKKKKQSRTSSVDKKIVVSIFVVAVLLVSAIVGWTAGKIEKSVMSTSEFYCEGFVVDYPSDWYTGNANTACHLSNTPSSEWPGISGSEEEGQVGISMSLANDRNAIETSLQTYVDEVGVELEKVSNFLDYPYEVKSIDTVSFDNFDAIRIVAEGGHYNRTETTYYIENDTRQVLAISVTSPDESLLEQGLSVVKTIRYQ
jgi:hypothetical protein